jgi:hypothetical protein
MRITHQLVLTKYNLHVNKFPFKTLPNCVLNAAHFTFPRKGIESPDFSTFLATVVIFWLFLSSHSYRLKYPIAALIWVSLMTDGFRQFFTC